jgi:hypothetical protein
MLNFLYCYIITVRFIIIIIIINIIIMELCNMFTTAKNTEHFD